VSPNSEDFPQIKRDLIDRVSSIEDFIRDTAERREEYRKLMIDINKKLNGDYLVYPPILGHEQRIIELEKVERERVKNKDWAIKTATGALTIGIGGAVIWICNVLRDAFIKH